MTWAAALWLSPTALAQDLPPGAGPVTNAPRADHHQHLLSEPAAEFVNRFDGPKTTALSLPPAIARLMEQRTARWNNAAELEKLYTADAVLLENGIAGGRKEVASALAKRFSAPYRLVPIASGVRGSSAQVATYLVRGEGSGLIYIGSGLLSLTQSPDGSWRIAGESVQIPGPRHYRPMGADDLVKQLNEAQIRRAVVLSVAYFFGTAFAPARADELALVQAENDWTAAEVARHPERLVAFCSVNPLKNYAVAEIERCSGRLGMRGLKLHFANSDVDLARPDHVAKVRAVFATANRLRIPIVAHLWTVGRNYGAKDSRAFLDRVLPVAPDILVQIAHMAGAGPGWTDDALAVLAEAVAAKDPRTRNLYFDLATVADNQSPERLQLLARRIRQIGLDRILYGSDAAFGGRNTANQEWGTFRGMVPLTDAEFAVIRDNVAPYLR